MTPPPSHLLVSVICNVCIPQTNDSSVLGAVKMENFVIVMSKGIKSSDDNQHFKKWMEAHFQGNFTSVDVKSEGLAVAEFLSGTQSTILKTIKTTELVFAGEQVQLLPAYLIWIPFSVPHVSV